MFQRLLNSLGQPANQRDRTTLLDPELQLATAVLLFGILPVDYEVTADEGCALRRSLTRLFTLSPQKSKRMIARAAAAHSHDPSVVAACTLLKRRTSEAFRMALMAEARNIIQADGVLHAYELDLGQRIERLLGLASENLQQSA